MIYIALNMKSKLSLFAFLKHVPFLIMEDSLVHVITKKTVTIVIIVIQNCFALFYLSYFGMYCPLFFHQWIKSISILFFLTEYPLSLNVALLKLL